MREPSMTPTPVEQVRRNPSPLTNGTWVLIADGEKALFVENVGDADYPLFEVRREDHQPNPPTREQAANRPGRMPDGPSAHRSALDDTDWHELAKERFANDLAEMLYKRAQAGLFDRLIIAAGPQTLGNLRPELHKEVTDRLVGEVDLVLTNHPLDEMATRINAALVAD